MCVCVPERSRVACHLACAPAAAASQAPAVGSAAHPCLRHLRRRSGALSAPSRSSSEATPSTSSASGRGGHPRRLQARPLPHRAPSRPSGAPQSLARKRAWPRSGALVELLSPISRSEEKEKEAKSPSPSPSKKPRSPKKDLNSEDKSTMRKVHVPPASARAPRQSRKRVGAHLSARYVPFLLLSVLSLSVPP